MISKNTISSFGELIRSMREGLNLSLREVAFNLGIDTSLLGKIERDERPPTKEQIKEIADYYKLDEKLLIRENLSDQLAYKIIEADTNIDILKVAEKKIEYLKTKNNK